MPTRRKGVVQDINGGSRSEASPDDMFKNVREKLAHDASVYMFMSDKMKEFEAEKKKAAEKIRGFLAAHPEVLNQVGNHREVVVEFQNLMEILVRLQVAVSASYADDAIQWLRNKLGAEAETYIVKREELVPGAAEALYNAGKITEQEVSNMVVTKSTESLIVKEHGKKTIRKKKA